jgi:hypothetical protein
MTRIHAMSLALLLVAAGACSDNNGSGPPANEMAGTWTATRLEFVEAANPTNKIEVIGLGGSATVTLTENHDFTIVSSMPGESSETSTGTWSTSSDVMTFHFSSGLSGTWQFDYSLSGTTLTLNGAHTDFDFNGDDVMEDGRVNLVLQKQ